MCVANGRFPRIVQHCLHSSHWNSRGPQDEVWQNLHFRFPGRGFNSVYDSDICKVKNKGAPVHDLQVYRGSGGVTPLILNLGSKRR